MTQGVFERTLRGASHVDYATGAREINQGVGDTLASQVGQLLVGSGFSQAAAAKASASLVQQFTSASPTTSAIALSLVNQDQSSGTYNSKISSGTEASAYSVKNTSKLSLTFNLNNGDISVKVEKDRIAATRIEWSSDTANDVSIILTQPELDAVNFTPSGIKHNLIDSVMRETVENETNTSNSIGSSNVPGTNALKFYLDFENKTSSLLPHNVELASSTNPTHPLTNSISKTNSMEAATSILKKLITKMNSSLSQAKNQHLSVNLQITQHVGIVLNHNNGVSFLYNRPVGDAAVINAPSFDIKA